MLREISAGGVVIRKQDGVWWMAAIELPADEPAVPVSNSNRTPARAQAKAVLCLPKGLVDAGEKALEAALREVREETGVTASLLTKIADIKYRYVRTWSDGQQVFKIVSFYLLEYESGEIDNISPAMRVEVARAKWVRLEDGPKLLAYRGEKQMARKALDYIAEHLELKDKGSG
jgi:8-oxo-dGTP pyrophosphatase MutT (NUDIX family)